MFTASFDNTVTVSDDYLATGYLQDQYKLFI